MCKQTVDGSQIILSYSKHLVLCSAEEKNIQVWINLRVTKWKPFSFLAERSL